MNLRRWISVFILPIGVCLVAYGEKIHLLGGSATFVKISIIAALGLFSALYAETADRVSGRPLFETFGKLILGCGLGYAVIECLVGPPSNDVGYFYLKWLICLGTAACVSLGTVGGLRLWLSLRE